MPAAAHALGWMHMQLLLKCCRSSGALPRRLGQHQIVCMPSRGVELTNVSTACLDGPLAGQHVQAVSSSSHSQDDLVVDLDNVEVLGCVVLAVCAQLVLHHHTAPVHVADNVLAVLQGSTTSGVQCPGGLSRLGVGNGGQERRGMVCWTDSSSRGQTAQAAGKSAARSREGGVQLGFELCSLYGLDVLQSHTEAHYACILRHTHHHRAASANGYACCMSGPTWCMLGVVYAREMQCYAGLRCGRNNSCSSSVTELVLSRHTELRTLDSKPLYMWANSHMQCLRAATSSRACVGHAHTRKCLMTGPTQTHLCATVEPKISYSGAHGWVFSTCSVRSHSLCLAYTFAGTWCSSCQHEA